MRTILALALLAAVVATGCGITSSTSEPVAVAPSLQPGEQPIAQLPLAGSDGSGPLTLRIFDRSLALVQARSATKAELAELTEVGDLDPNAIGLYNSVEGEVLLVWTGSACPAVAELFVGAGVTDLLIVSPDNECGAGSSVRGVHLTFKPNVDIKRIHPSFARPAAA